MSGGELISGGQSMAGGMSNVGGESMGGMPQRGQYGEGCNCASDCESGFCVQNKMRRMRTCTDQCDQDSDCLGLATCLQAVVQESGPSCPDINENAPPVGTQVGVCITNETGYPCEQPNQCTSGICLSPPTPVDWASPQSICTMNCMSDDKCPAGYQCREAQGVNGRVCQPQLEVSQCPGGQATECGGICPIPSGRQEADIVICLNMQPNTPGYCSCSCVNASDCPNGFACSQIGETGDPTRPGVCLPISGYQCPQSNDGVEQCLSATCAVEDEVEFSYCTAFCNNDASCPTGYRCESVDGSQPICTPSRPPFEE
jgi:hypothetical protein